MTKKDLHELRMWLKQLGYVGLEIAKIFQLGRLVKAVEQQPVRNGHYTVRINRNENTATTQRTVVNNNVNSANKKHGIDEISRYVDENTNVYRYSYGEWNRIKSRYTPLKLIDENSGLYYGAFNDKRALIIVDEPES